MARETTPAILAEAGFPIGPVGEPCVQCGHPWDEHRLIASKSGIPLDGGDWACPTSGCGCWGTWDVPAMRNRN